MSGWYIPEDGSQRPQAPQERTGAGLPRRVPRSHLAPALASVGAGVADGRGAGTNGATGPPPEVRKPDEVRDSLAAYRSGFERGRQEAGKWFKDLIEQPPDGPTRPPGTTF